MQDHDRALAEAAAHLRAGDEAAAVRLWLRHAEDRRALLCLREWAVAERRLDLLDGVLQRLAGGGDEQATICRAIQAQLRGDAAGALSLLQPLLASPSAPAAAHHHAGRALHNLGRREEAQAAFLRALQRQPDYAEARYSQAHALRASGRLDEAIAAYRAVLEWRPGSRAALLNLGITLCAAERAGEALAPLERLLAIEPESVDGWINKGLCLHVLGRLVEAEDCYLAALRRAPAHPQAHFYLGCLRNEQFDSAGAQSHLEAALRAAPDDPDIRAELAGLMEQNNDLAAAARHVQAGLAVAPAHPALRLEAARLARREGRLDEARGLLLALVPQTLPARQAQQYWFERAWMHDRAREPAEAMAALERAHALAAASPRRHGIERDAYPRRVEAVAAWIARGAPGASPRADDPPPVLPFRPAFLVGFPRSGTTLLDTILDAHPDVASIEEQATLEPVADRLLGEADGAYPEAMPRLDGEALHRARMRYRTAVEAWITPGFRGVVLDKLPLRLLRVPLLHRMFPDAPILFAERHPCDVVLSNVMQQYRPNEAFVHFDSIADAARMYDQVMRTWRAIVEALPLRLHRVRYERLVEDPEAEIAAACAALGVGFAPAMLEHERRLQGRGRIATNSYQQVAEPLYRRSVERWRAYRPWFEPVLPLLRPHLAWLGYPDPDA